LIKLNCDGSGVDRNWDRNWGDLTLAYRMTPHSATGYCPFELEYGRLALKYSHDVSFSRKPVTEDQYEENKRKFGNHQN
jgi:hypothetical protein